LTALVADLVAVQDAIGDEPVLVGASMGGMTALIAEGEIGGIASGLVLVDIVARLEPAGVDRIRAFMGQAPNGFASLDQVADAVAAYSTHRARPTNLDGLRRNVRLKEDGRWYWHWDPAFLQGGDEPAREVGYERARSAASRLTVPTMVVHGGESDIVSPEGVKEMADLIPDAVIVEITSAGHMVAGDDNDIFTTKLASFLSSI
jgi:pimeloyl-ACP methyl ester carboxylesterase